MKIIMKNPIFFWVLIAFPTMALEIRPPLPHEINDVAYVYYTSWHDTFHDSCPHLVDVITQEYCLQKWQKYFQSNTHFMLVAVLHNKIVGVTFAGPIENAFPGLDDYDSEIDKLYVLPEYKSQGIGSRLFQETCNALRCAGFKKAIVLSLTKNQNANQFYEKKDCVLLLQLSDDTPDTLNVYGFDLLFEKV